MNDAMPPETTSPRPPQDEPYGRPPMAPDHTEDLNLGAIFGNLWEGRYLLFGSVALFLVVGVLYAWTAAPVYQVEGLLQTESQKTYAPQANDFTKIEGAYALPTVAQGEIEIIKSNLVLGRAVERQKLDVVAEPILMPVLGKLRNLNPKDRPRLDLETLTMPVGMRGTPFRLTILGGGAFQVSDPAGAVLGQGRPGEPVFLSYEGSPFTLKVKSFHGRPGQAFAVSLSPLVDAINDLRLNLQVEERGKNAYASSNILWLSLQASDPERGAATLNEILNQYLRQAIERKAGESSKALALLQNQRPVLQAQLAEAEGRLNGFRRQRGSVDMAREGELYLQKGSALDTDLSLLKQKREELLRTYTEHSDVVATVNHQIANIQNEARKVESKVTALPQTQQEIVRLTRDAQVKAEMYTSLLNTIQQLQSTLAGSAGNSRVVDYALPAYDPIAPKKKILLILFLFIGSVVGVGLTVLRRMLQRGIEDHRVIETRLGLPVLVTIPHSRAQSLLDRARRKKVQGLHLLAAQERDDLAAESLRSLRTFLHFKMEHQANRIIMVTGPTSEIGKSFVSSNLAIVLAQSGSRVLLVDADLRKGSLHRAFGLLRRDGGLAEILAGRADWKSSLQRTAVPNLSLITTGLLPEDPLVFLMSPAFKAFTTQVSAAFDFVILDAPPLLPVTDAVVIGAKVGTILLVAKYGAHSVDELRTCLKRLKDLGSRLSGCVFNDIKLVDVGGAYGYYKYNYDYKYEKAKD
jgi:tyrosine-protein kinase Etk/Wzc